MVIGAELTSVIYRNLVVVQNPVKTTNSLPTTKRFPALRNSNHKGVCSPSRMEKICSWKKTFRSTRWSQKCGHRTTGNVARTYLETMNSIMEIPSNEVATHNHTWNSKGDRKENMCVSSSFPFRYRILIPVPKNEVFNEVNVCGESASRSAGVGVKG